MVFWCVRSARSLSKHGPKTKLFRRDPGDAGLTTDSTSLSVNLTSFSFEIVNRTDSEVPQGTIHRSPASRPSKRRQAPGPRDRCKRDAERGALSAEERRRGGRPAALRAADGRERRRRGETLVNSNSRHFFFFHFSSSPTLASCSAQPLCRHHCSGVIVISRALSAFLNLPPTSGKKACGDFNKI